MEERERVCCQEGREEMEGKCEVRDLLRLGTIRLAGHRSCSFPTLSGWEGCQSGCRIFKLPFSGLQASSPRSPFSHCFTPVSGQHPGSLYLKYVTLLDVVIFKADDQGDKIRRFKNEKNTFVKLKVWEERSEDRKKGFLRTRSPLSPTHQECTHLENVEGTYTVYWKLVGFQTTNEAMFHASSHLGLGKHIGRSFTLANVSLNSQMRNAISSQLGPP